MAVRRLQGSPSMLPLLARAGAAAIPGASRLPFVGGGSHEMPDLTFVLDGVEVDRDRLTAYDRVCGFSPSETLPATYPHILAFPLHLRLMTDGSFPFAAIGLVHIANRITHHRPVESGETMSLRVWATAIETHPRGRQFSLRSEARVGEELVWEEASTNLRRGGGTAEESGGERQTMPAGELPTAATWSLPGDLGRRYGSVSGDLNPIHIHPLTARLFGFPSAIAHGMWTKARCIAALKPRLPDAFTVEVAFRKPILLPAKVEFGEEAAAQRDEAADGGGIRFGVRDASNRTPHLDGRITFDEGAAAGQA